MKDSQSEIVTHHHAIENIHFWETCPFTNAKLKSIHLLLGITGLFNTIYVRVNSHPESTLTQTFREYEEVRGHKLPVSTGTEGVNKCMTGQRAVHTFTTVGVHYNTAQVASHTAIFSSTFSHTKPEPV